MSSYTEWELMVIEEDLEPGDIVFVDENGTYKEFIFVRDVGKIVYLREKGSKILRKFNTKTLEEMGDNNNSNYIVGRV